MKNKAGIDPIQYKVLILPDTVESEMESGLFIPDTVKEKEQAAAVRGVLVAMGTQAFEEIEIKKPVVGERVLFSKYAGMIVMGNDKVEYRLCNDQDICAIIDRKE